MKRYNRILNLHNLLKQKSFFLFGPRSIGKTFLIKQQLQSAKIYDLLDEDVFGRLARRSKILEEELSSESILVIDEVQKLPKLLDEVHRLIEKRGIRFLLTGSSARKLKRGGQNLLGGRAREAHLLPLVASEISDFDLQKYLNYGGIPHIYLSESPQEDLKSYVNLYLREEIANEALTRKVDQFARFLDVVGLQNGEELHYQGLSSDSGVPARTLQNYVQILEDTLIAFQVPAFCSTKKRKAITRSKLYLFDVGVANSLVKSGEIVPRSALWGKVFEHFIMMELRAYLNYRRLDLPLQYWRSTSGFEVDCIIGNRIAIEIKATEMVNERHLRGLKALKDEGLIENFVVVSEDPVFRRIDGIAVYPWEEFLKELWADQLIKIQNNSLTGKPLV